MNTDVNISASKSLSDQQKQHISEHINDIVGKKSRTILEFVESLRSDIISKDVSTREMAINELSAVLLQLPNDILTPQTCNFLLEFLLPRVEDSGHVAAEFLVAVVQHLILCCGVELSRNVLAQAIEALYETNGVQSYAQRDRMRLFELFHHLLDKFLHEIKVIFEPTRFIVAFMRAANSERDPRCLLKIFRIFIIIVRNFPIGNLAEDLFELIACYYPIDYEPTDNDVGKISSTMLSAGCEACLLVHEAFEPFCFQLISDKLLEENDDLATGDGAIARLHQQLSVCEFLCKACNAFCGSKNYRKKDDVSQTEQSALIAELENILTAFRLIALNPTQTLALLTRTRRILNDTAHAIFKYIYFEKNEVIERLEFIAHNSLEHCEPFVLQAEMGLTGRALIVLEAIAEPVKTIPDSLILTGIIVPKVLNWFIVLFKGMTLKNIENRREICEECISFLPKWFEISCYIPESCGRAERCELYKLYVDIFNAIDDVAEFCTRQKILLCKFECAHIANFSAISKVNEGGDILPISRQIYEHVKTLLESVILLMDDQNDCIHSRFIEGDDRSITNAAVVRAATVFINGLNSEYHNILKSLRNKLMENKTSKSQFIILYAISTTCDECILPIFLNKIACNNCQSELVDSFLLKVRTLSFRERCIKSEELENFNYGSFWDSLLIYLWEDNLVKFPQDLQIQQSLYDFLQDLGAILLKERYEEFARFFFFKMKEVKNIVKENQDSFYTFLLNAIGSFLSTSKSEELLNDFVELVISYMHDVLEKRDEVKKSLLNFLFYLYYYKPYFSKLSEFKSLILSAFCQCSINIAVEVDNANMSMGHLPFVEDINDRECVCGWRFRMRVVRARALLLNDPHDGIVAVRKLFDNLMFNGDTTRRAEDLSFNLLDFPTRFVSKTPLLRQRIFCQFVPLYVERFFQIPNEKSSFKIAFLQMIEPLFCLAKTIDRQMSDEWKMIFPIITHTFQHIFDSTPISHYPPLDVDRRLLFDAALELINITADINELCVMRSDSDNSTKKSLPPLVVFLRAFTDVLQDENANLMLVMCTLECLKAVARKAGGSVASVRRRVGNANSVSANDILRAFNRRVIEGAARRSRCSKRLIRQHAAAVRNICEKFFNAERCFYYDLQRIFFSLDDSDVDEVKLRVECLNRLFDHLHRLMNGTTCSSRQCIFEVALMSGNVA